MMTLLPLPTLAPGIPMQLRCSSAGRSPSLLARRLYEAGVIEATVPARAASEPAQTAKRYLQRWVAQQLSGLQCLNVHVRIFLGQADEEFSGDAEGRAKATALWSSDVEPFAVGAALEAMEAVQVGLGQTVLTAIDLIGVSLVPAFTTWDAMCVAQEHYWYGEQNEEVALDETCGDDEAEREAMRETIVTRKMVDESFPAWATEWPKSRKALSQRALASVADLARSTRVRRVAALTLALKRLRLKDECRPNGDGWFIGFGACLCWRERDLVARIFDDLCNDAVQSEYVDWCGQHRMDLEDADSVKAWMNLMRPRFLGIGLLDQLIFELSTGDWSHIPKGFK